MIKSTVRKFNIVTLLIVLMIIVYSLINWARYAKEFLCVIYWRGVEVAESNLDANSMSEIINNTLKISDEAIAEMDSKWQSYSYLESDLSGVDSRMTYQISGQIQSAQIIKGSEGWLFFNSKEKGYVDTMADYEGVELYDDSVLEAIKDNALHFQEEMDIRGIQYVLFIPPNKENVYYDYMPSTYVHSEKSRTDYLIDYLDESGINVVSPKNDLLDSCIDNQLYYKTDSHCNQLGGYVGVKSIMDYWDISYPSIENREITSYELKSCYHMGAMGDLAAMSGLSDYYNDDLEYEVKGTIPIDWKSYEDEQDGDIVSVYINEAPLVNKKVLLLGDSYRTSMVPALAEIYGEVYVTSRGNLTLGLIDEIAPDYIILEYVERYSREIEYLELK